MAMSLRTPDWRQGWSNLHMFMQTCGEARGSFCGARTRCACPLPLARACGPRPQAPCDGSRVAPCPALGHPTLGQKWCGGPPGREGSGPAGPPWNLRPVPLLTRHPDHGFFHPNNRETMLFASFS
jgi:hypothetical protein